MAKKQSFSDKSSKKAHAMSCPVCQETLQYVKFVKSIKTDTGAWKFRTQNVGVCKCNHSEVYG